MATSKVWLITGAGRRSRWPQRFGSRLTLTVSCHLPSHTTMRLERLPGHQRFDLNRVSVL